MTRNENLEAIIDVPRYGLGPFPWRFYKPIATLLRRRIKSNNVWLNENITGYGRLPLEKMFYENTPQSFNLTSQVHY